MKWKKSQRVRVPLLCVVDLNPCRTNPCLNGGMCTLDRGDFLCLCSPQYHGKTCDSGNDDYCCTGISGPEEADYLYFAKRETLPESYDLFLYADDIAHTIPDNVCIVYKTCSLVI